MPNPSLPSDSHCTTRGIFVIAGLGVTLLAGSAWLYLNRGPSTPDIGKQSEKAQEAPHALASHGNPPPFDNTASRPAITIVRESSVSAQITSTFDDFDQQIGRSLLLHWKANFPPSLSKGLCAKAQLTLGPEGEIKHAKIFAPSGIQEFDNSVENLLLLLDSIQQPLPQPTKDGEYNIIAEFRLE